MRLPTLAALAALLVVSASPAASQINTERLRKDVEPGTHLQLDLSGGFAAGNTDFLRVGAGARVDVVRDRDNAFATGSYTFYQVDDVTDISRGFAHVRYNRPLAPRLVGELFVQAQRDEQTLLEQRYLAGGGLRYAILERETIGVAAGTTPMYEYESLEDRAMEDPSSAFRWSNYASLRVDVSETAEAFAVVYLQPRLDDFGDYRLLHESRLDVKLSERFRLRVRAGTRYDSDPPLGVEASDLSLMTGVVYTSVVN